MSGQYDELKFHVCRAIALAAELGGASSGSCWPQAMGIKKACEYLDIGETKFREMLKVGDLPEEFPLGGRPHWHRAELDKAIKTLSRRKRE